MAENSAVASGGLGEGGGMTRREWRVSVIVPTFNRRDLLGRALGSVFAQTAPPAEVIVVDDGSTDGTESFLRDRFPEAIYLRQPNQGVSSARNSGIRWSGGDWVAFLDSDDRWLPGKLEVQYQRLRAQPDMKVCHTEELWIRNGRQVNPARKHLKQGGWIFHRCLPLCAMSPSSILIHRSVFDRVGLFDEYLPACEDYDLWLRIAARFPVLFVEEPLIVKYGGHPDQLSRKYWGMDRFRIRALEKLLEAGNLPSEYARAARDMLLKKAEIYIAGARKRGKDDDVARYEALCRRFSEGAGEHTENTHG